MIADGRRAPSLTATVKIPDVGKLNGALAAGAIVMGGRPSETVTVIVPELVFVMFREPPTLRRTAGRSGTKAPPSSRIAIEALRVSPVCPSI
jgi:hypothetical protein